MGLERRGKNMANVNYQQELNKIISDSTFAGIRPRVLLHCCCAPCSSYVLKLLVPHFDVTCYYFNPNIFPEEEYQRRKGEFAKLFSNALYDGDIYFMEGEYTPSLFYGIAKNFETLKEGKERCQRCFALRLYMTATIAKDMDFDYFTTTLTVSPHKNATDINDIGTMISQMTDIKWLPSDFKKNNGFIESIELSKAYGLYRQSYCGCEYSFAERMSIFND